MVVRSRLTSTLGRQFGYALYARKPIGFLAERDVLACDVRQDPVQVIATAVHREPQRIYDDIVLTDAGGYYGLVSMRLLMAHSKDLLIQSMAEVGVLVQKNRTLDELNRLQGEFVANMTHELRAPLNTMLGVADLLASDPAIPDVRRRDVRMLLTRGRDLLGIVNNFLEMHRAVPLVLFSSNEEGSLRRMAREIGAFGYICKSEMGAGFSARILGLLEQRARPGDA